MALCQWLLFFFTSLFIARVIQASEGDADPLYRDCVEHCKKTGCVGNHCNQNCDFTTNGNFSGSLGYLEEPLYLKWKQWDCNSDCRYKCMIAREEEREKHGEKPIKYNGKWAFRRVYGFEEPVSVALSALNLAIQFHGWISFFILVHYNLPLKHKRKTYYEYTTLWHIHAILAMNSWFWSAVYHGRDLDLTQKLDYSSAAALIGYGLILSIFRVFSIKEEASRVIVAAPLIAFVTTHILFINFYYLDYDHTQSSKALELRQLNWSTRYELDGVCNHGFGSTSAVGCVGYCDAPSFLLEVVGGGLWRCYIYAIAD